MPSNEKELLARLASDAGTEEKARACQQLAIVGGPLAVPALAALLGDENLAAHARSGLENIAAPSAGEALRKALPTLKGRLLAGAVTSLGVRRETSAVPEIQQLANDPTRGVAEPALAALGRIASDEAVAAIRKTLADGPAGLRIPAAHAALAAADLPGNGNHAKMLLDAVGSADVPAHIKAAASRR